MISKARAIKQIEIIDRILAILDNNSDANELVKLGAELNKT
jgi:hypothetical protein